LNNLASLVKEMNQITGKAKRIEKIELGNPEIPTKEEELKNAEAELAKEKGKVSSLEEEVANKGSLLGMSPTEKAKLDDLDRIIEQLEIKVNTLTNEKNAKQTELTEAKSIYEKDKARLQALELKLRDVRSRGVPEFYIGTKTITCKYCNAELRLNAIPLLITLIPIWKNFKCPVCDNVVHRMSPSSNIKLVTKPPEEPKSLLTEILYLKGTKEWTPGAGLPDIPAYKGKIETDEENLTTTEAELATISNDLEIARNSLLDAQSTRARIHNEINGAIALRQYEYEAALARLDLEKRVMVQIELNIQLLRTEIEQAKREAEADAARDREALMKAQEEERARIAEEQRKLAEELEKEAQETAGVEKEEYDKRITEAKRKSNEAYEAALEAALEREKAAKEVALKEAEALKKRIEAETLKKEITPPVVIPVAGKIAGLPSWVWWLAGGGGIATILGIAIAKKKKK